MDTPSGSTNLGVVVAGLVLALVVSVGGTGYFYFQMRRVEAERQELAATSPRVLPKPAGEDTGEAARLREMLAEKETAYAKLQSDLEQLKAARTATSRMVALGDGSNMVVSADTGGRSFGRGRFGGPEMETRMRESREQFRQQAEARYQDQVTKLQARRQQAKTPEEAALVDQLLASVNDLYAVGQSWGNLSDPAVTNRAAVAAQLAEQSRTAYATYNELRAKDRQFQLQQLAAQVGYKDAAQAKQFTESIERIYDETDSSIPRMMGFGGFGRGGSSRSNSSSIVITPGL